jgi:hypothetical protein
MLKSLRLGALFKPLKLPDGLIDALHLDPKHWDAFRVVGWSITVFVRVTQVWAPEPHWGLTRSAVAVRGC